MAPTSRIMLREEGGGSLMCQLKNTIYGLKQRLCLRNLTGWWLMLVLVIAMLIIHSAFGKSGVVILTIHVHDNTLW